MHTCLKEQLGLIDPKCKSQLTLVFFLTKALEILRKDATEVLKTLSDYYWTLESKSAEELFKELREKGSQNGLLEIEGIDVDSTLLEAQS